MENKNRNILERKQVAEAKINRVISGMILVSIIRHPEGNEGSSQGKLSLKLSLSGFFTSFRMTILKIDSKEVHMNEREIIASSK